MKDGPGDATSALDRALHDPERSPLKRALAADLPEAVAQRMWRRLDAKPRREPVQRWVLLAASLGVLAVVAFFLARTPAGEPLRLASGATPNLPMGSSTAERVVFKDGSRLELSANGRVEVLRNDGQSFVTVLRRGRGLFDVKPGGSRRWVIEAGLATVEVLGTRFTVDRQPSSVRVSVDRGLVVVRAESLPNGARQLGAGASVEIAAAYAAATPGPPVTAPATAASVTAPAPAAPAVTAPVTPGPHRTAPESHARSADVPDAIDRALAEADAARARGDSPRAAQLLREVVARAPAGDPRRGVAGLSLARLTMESDPGAAASALATAVPSMPSALAEDALARWAEAEARAGNRAKASELAREYLRRFPAGHRAEDVRRWLAP